MLYRKQRAEIDFAGLMMTILIWVTRSVKIGPGKLRTINCRLFWTRTIPNRKKCLPSNWVFLKQPFPCGYMPWGRFKRSENGCRKMGELNDRQMERRQNTCQILLAKKKVVPASDCVQAMKSGSIFRILTQEILSWSRPTINIFKTKSLWTEDDVVRLVGSGGYHLLRAVKTWWNC